MLRGKAGALLRQPAKVAWALVAIYLLGLAISAASRSQSDFVIYRNSGIQAAQGGEIYDFHHPSPFQYAPIYASAFIALGVLRPRPAQFLWFLISTVLALPVMILGASRLLFGRGFELRWELIVVPVLLCAQFIEVNFDHGQINLLLLDLVVWGLALAIESRARLAGALLAGSLLLKPLGVPVVLYLFAPSRLRFVISLLFFVAALLLLPCVLVGAGYALHQTAQYFRILTVRVPHLSHDLHNKYNQSAVAVAVRLLSGTPQRAGLLSQSAAATTGFAFQCVLTIAAVVWCRRRWNRGPERSARLSLAALFCVAAAFSPISWLEYYMALEVPYMALVFIASSTDERGRGGARAARLVLAILLIVNLGARLFEPAQYCGATYFSSLFALVAVVILVEAGASPPRAKSLESLTGTA
jgi:glycosyl transferase family 87